MINMTYQELLDKIRNRERFDFSRFGDGEWAAILQQGKQNCDGHQYFQDMGLALENILKASPDYYIGIQSLAKKRFGDTIEDYTDWYNLNWIEANIIHRENIKRGLRSLFDAVSDRDVLLVGPPHLKPLAELNNWYYLEIPSRNCWLKYKEIHEELKALIPVKDWVVLFCASMMANVLIDSFAGSCTLVDVGSAFDPYVNVHSRTYHHNLKI